MSIHKQLQKLTDDIYGVYEVVHDRYEIYNRIKQAYNLGIEAAANNAETTLDSANNVMIDKESILKLKI